MVCCELCVLMFNVILTVPVFLLCCLDVVKGVWPVSAAVVIPAVSEL